MKHQCLNCSFYSEDIDKLNNSMDDIIIENEQDTEKHYCLCYMYEGHNNKNNIPQEIWTDKSLCKFRRIN